MTTPEQGTPLEQIKEVLADLRWVAWRLPMTVSTSEYEEQPDEPSRMGFRLRRAMRQIDALAALAPLQESESATVCTFCHSQISGPPILFSVCDESCASHRPAPVGELRERLEEAFREGYGQAWSDANPRDGVGEHRENDAWEGSITFEPRRGDTIQGRMRDGSVLPLVLWYVCPDDRAFVVVCNETALGLADWRRRLHRDANGTLWVNESDANGLPLPRPMENQTVLSPAAQPEQEERNG